MHDQEKQKSVTYRLEQIRDRAPLICTPEEKYLKDLAIDTLDLLKEQKPRVMQFSEIMEIYNADPFHIWPYDTPPYLYIQEHPHVRNSSESWAAWREIKDIIEGELFGHTAQSYGKTWRCWMLKPSFQQRQVTPWNQRSEETPPQPEIECVMCGDTFTEAELVELREMGEAYHREKGCFLCPDCWDIFRRMDPEEQAKIAITGRWKEVYHGTKHTD